MPNPRAFVALLALLLACAFLGCLPDIDFGSDPGYRDPSPAAVRLDVPLVRAPRADWTWAAAATSVLLYDQTPAEPCALVSTWGQADCCTAGPEDCAFPPPAAAPLASLLLDAGLPSLAVAGRLTFEEVKREIDAGNPVLVHYTQSFDGHVVVLFGYDDGVPDDLAVFVHDPIRGTSFSPFGDNFGRAPIGSTWAETVLVRTDPGQRMGWDPLGEDEIDWQVPMPQPSRAGR